jgi:hypothetical protein
VGVLDSSPLVHADTITINSNTTQPRLNVANSASAEWMS